MATQKMQIGMILAIAMAGIAISVLVVALLTTYPGNLNNGNITVVKLGVYSDSSCTNNVTSITWGELDLGTNATFTVYIKNLGTAPLKLNMTTTSWNPAPAQNSIHLYWNRENYVLNSESSVQAILTLSVSSNVTGLTDFSFDIIIAGVGQP